MNLAIMQPYFLPYHGYWQLISHVDRFVIFDDVNFIKRGWINRNRILVNSAPAWLTLELENASQNRRIRDTRLNRNADWRSKLLKKVDYSYRKSPNFEEAFSLFSTIMDYKTESLAEFLAHSIQSVLAALRIDTEIVTSSAVYGNDHLKGSDRIIDICTQEHAVSYTNAIGGRSLYSPEEFEKHRISLSFLDPGPLVYAQKADDFVPNLSILDSLMAMHFEELSEQLSNYRIIG